MFKKLMLLSAVALSLATNAQDSKKGFYLKAGGSYFIQTAATEFPIVSGQSPNTDVYDASGLVLTSRETNHGSFGSGSRANITGGFRITERLGVEMGVNYFSGNSKTMVETKHRLVAPFTYVDGSAVGTVRALDLSPSIVLYLGEVNKFEPYTKVGVLVPVYGNLTIETNRTFTNPIGTTNTYAKDVVKPNPTIGYMGVVGTAYKLSNKLSLYAEVEYRNFTVHGKSKETETYTENNVDKLYTSTAFRPDASYSASHVNYVDQLNSTSNSKVTNAANFDNTKPTDDISSFIGISGVGLSVGVKYSL